MEREDILIQRIAELEATCGELKGQVARLQEGEEKFRLMTAELQETQKFLQTIIDYLPVAVFVKDGRENNFGAIKVWNQTCEKMFGLSTSLALGKTGYDLFPRWQAEFFEKKDREAFARGTPEDIPSEPVDAPGLGRRILHTIKVPIYDENLQPEYLVCISEDITERQVAVRDVAFATLRERERVETALCPSEAKQTSLMNDVLDNSEVGLFILDADFRIVWLNSALEKYFGLRREDVIGLDKRKTISDRIRYIFEDPESFTNIVFATYDNNTYIENFECHVLAGENRKERWLEHLSQPIRFGHYAGGRIEHYTDITARKKTAEELREVNRALRTLSDCNQVLVRATTEEDLLNEICQICVKVGGYRFAWVGYPQDDEEKTVLTVAQAGFEVLDTLDAKTKVGFSLTEIAVRTGEVSTCQNILNSPLSQKPGFCLDAIQRGYASAIALPLIIEGPETSPETRFLRQTGFLEEGPETRFRKVFGVLNLYSSRGDAFDEGELKLLRELADDLAYGITALRTEKAHLESEAKFRQLAENIQDVFWMSNADETEILYVSPAYEEIWGRSCESLYANPRSYFDSIYQEDRDRLIAPSRKKELASFEMEYRIVRPDGSLRWIWDRGFAIANEKGEVYRRAGIAKDITERKQAEELLHLAKEELEMRVQERTAQLQTANEQLQRELQQRLQAEEERSQLIAILEATTDFVSSATVDGEIVYLNQAARQILGLTTEAKLSDRTIPQAHPEWARAIVINEGIPAAIRDGAWLGETALISYDGREIPLSQLIIAHKSADGRVNFLSTIARDITQQKQSQATLLEAERRWRSLLENVRLVVVGLDTEGRVEYVNPFFLELTGYDRAEVLGKNWFKDFLPRYEQSNVGQYFQEIIARRDAIAHYQNAILTKLGEEKIIAWNNTLLQNVAGEAIATMSIGEDVTERYAIERMKDEFISVVSHELRTPLTSIHGALNLLSSGLIAPASERGERVINIAADSAERLVRLVNDILELERLESSKISLSKEVVNAADLLTMTAEQMQVMANRSGICLQVLPREIKLYADGDRIVQVLTNLVSNAIKFSSSGSTVELTVTLDDYAESSQDFSSKIPVAVFQVKDEGRGIPSEKIEKIFERFHQVDASDSRQKGGTGLGLAICRSIVEQHGGRIWVESIIEQGSTFYFALPIHK